jgi:MoxR-like ATPase
LRAALVATLCGQNLILLGPPGTAKSLLITLLAQSLQLQRFLLLLTKFSTPEELSGPISIVGLKQDDYRRLTTARMPEAQFVFLDEPFKASSAILNTMLTMINERLFDNGGRRVAIPLIALFGASNELPQGADLQALWDRFTMRVMVEYVSKTAFPRLLGQAAARPSEAVLRIGRHNGQAVSPTPAAPSIVIAPADLFAVMERVAHVPVPGSVQVALIKLAADLADKGIVVSDRRWEQALDALRAHAILEGRGIVTVDDISICRHMFWNTPEQRGEIARLVERVGNPLNVRAVDLGDQAMSAFQAAMPAQSDGQLDDLARMSAAVEGNAKLKKIGTQLAQLLEEARTQGYTTTKIERTLARIRAQQADVAGLIL